MYLPVVTVIDASGNSYTEVSLVNAQSLEQLNALIQTKWADMNELLKNGNIDSALTNFLDGQVSAVIGTHTHIQTADERVLPGGTAYITDVGITGPGMSVIGASKEISIRRSLTQIPMKLEVSDTSAVIMGAAVTIDSKTGKSIAIESTSPVV